VTLSSWVAVARVLKEFKKKRNSAFYLEIEELDYWCYIVRVYDSKHFGGCLGS
jgi:hypothetical protein